VKMPDFTYPKLSYSDTVSDVPVNDD